LILCKKDEQRNNGMPYLVSDDEDQESINGTPGFEVQDDMAL
jgi:hypothetical protein